MWHVCDCITCQRTQGRHECMMPARSCTAETAGTKSRRHTSEAAALVALLPCPPWLTGKAPLHSIERGHSGHYVPCVFARKCYMCRASRVALAMAPQNAVCCSPRTRRAASLYANTRAVSATMQSRYCQGIAAFVHQLCNTHSTSCTPSAVSMSPDLLWICAGCAAAASSCSFFLYVFRACSSAFATLSLTGSRNWAGGTAARLSISTACSRSASSITGLFFLRVNMSVTLPCITHAMAVLHSPAWRGLKGRAVK